MNALMNTFQTKNKNKLPRMHIDGTKIVNVCNGGQKFDVVQLTKY